MVAERVRTDALNSKGLKHGTRKLACRRHAVRTDALNSKGLRLRIGGCCPARKVRTDALNSKGLRRIGLGAQTGADCSN